MTRSIVVLFAVLGACGGTSGPSVPVEKSVPKEAAAPPTPEGLSWGDPLLVPHEHVDFEWYEGTAIQADLHGVSMLWFAMGYCHDRLCALRGGAVHRAGEDRAGDRFASLLSRGLGIEPTDVSDAHFSPRIDDAANRPDREALYWRLRHGGVLVVQGVDADGARDPWGMETWWSEDVSFDLLASGRLSDCGWGRLHVDGSRNETRLPWCTGSEAARAQDAP